MASLSLLAFFLRSPPIAHSHHHPTPTGPLRLSTLALGARKGHDQPDPDEARGESMGMRQGLDAAIDGCLTLESWGRDLEESTLEGKVDSRRPGHPLAVLLVILRVRSGTYQWYQYPTRSPNDWTTGIAQSISSLTRACITLVHDDSPFAAVSHRVLSSHPYRQPTDRCQWGALSPL